MRIDSLAVRLFLSAAVWASAALAIAAIFLVNLYRVSAESAFDKRLDLYLNNIAAAIEPDRNPVISSNPTTDPNFVVPESGWYWQVKTMGSDQVVAKSGSLVDPLELPSEVGIEIDETFTRRGYVSNIGGRRLRTFERDIEIGAKVYSIAVWGDADEIDSEISDFRWAVILTLTIMGAGLVAATLLQVRWGLGPLQVLRRELAKVRNGNAEILEGRFPTELTPLVDDLNGLIVSNREIINRARTHVGNLAHALKTPLSVIRNEARQSSAGHFGAKVDEQANLMEDQVSLYLERARMAARTSVIGEVTEIKPIVDTFRRTMLHIHGERGVAINACVDDHLRFRGERQDFEEMLGNLMDNACKWARSSVEVSAVLAEDGDHPDRRNILLTVEDDGPGLTPEECAEAVRRGRRLDETVPGSGLGLSIVSELAELYGGSLSLDRGRLGGLRAILRLYAV